MSRLPTPSERALPPAVAFSLMRVIVARENCERYRKQLSEPTAGTKKRKLGDDPTDRPLKDLAATRNMLQLAETYLAQMLSAFQTQFPEYLDVLDDIVRNS